MTGTDSRYRLVYGHTPADLATIVTKRIREGWELHGGPFAAVHYNAAPTTLFYQAMLEPVPELRAVYAESEEVRAG